MTIFRTRMAVSELYASLLMIGVTLSFGSLVTISAVNQFNLSTASTVLSGSLQMASGGKQLSLVFAAVTPGSGGCAVTYRGVVEGKSLTLSLFDYGAASFAPTEIVDNSTVYVQGLAPISPGSVVTYSMSLAACAHVSGQSFLLLDQSGDEVQFGT
jgi:hypothetical protein